MLLVVLLGERPLITLNHTVYIVQGLVFKLVHTLGPIQGKCLRQSLLKVEE